MPEISLDPVSETFHDWSSVSFRILKYLHVPWHDHCVTYSRHVFGVFLNFSYLYHKPR